MKNMRLSVHCMYIFIINFMISFAPNLLWSSSIDNNQKYFQKGIIQAKGISASGQSKYNAIESAKIIAQKNLIEQIKGIIITNTTQMKNGIIISDIIQSKVSGLIRGAQSCGQTFYKEKGYAEVCMEIKLNGQGGVYDIIYPFIQNLYPKDMVFISENNNNNNKLIEYNGLIIDIRQFSEFMPSLANRILDTNDRVVYDPSMVSQNILIQQGHAQFATNQDKGKAILSDFGSDNPLIITPKRLKNNTDIIVTIDDAETIYLVNKKTGMLHKARVVFVLK